MRFLIKMLERVVNLTTLLLVLAMLLLAGYSLWDANQVYQGAEAVVYEAYRPEKNDSLSFEQLRAVNPDVFGWLRVNDTHIDYPLVQAPDNQRYVNADAMGNYSLSGAIFLHCENARDFSDFNSIIYGHHMEKEKMFGEIGLFCDEAFFEEHRYGNLYFDGADHGLEFFAFMQADAYDDIFWAAVEGEEARREYLDRIMTLSMYTRDIGVTTEDRLVLLSTCTSLYTNGRHILVGRLSDTLYPEEPEAVNLGIGVDRVGDWLEQLPPWLWPALGGALLLALALGLLTWKKRRK